MIYSLIKKGSSSLQALGEGLEDPTDVESRVKKVKRFLQSKYTDCESFFFPYIRSLLAGLAPQGSLTLIIDGSDMGKKCAALMVSVAWGKRSLPLVWLTKTGQKGHFSEQDHLRVLRQVAALLPPTATSVVLLGDGEFDGCQLQAYTQQQGWKYVLRTAKNTWVEDQRGDQYRVGECAIEADKDYCWLPNCRFTQQKYGLVDLLIWHQNQHPDPIYLVSNLDWPPDMMDYYQKRYSIETIFGDMKSRGFRIDKTRIKDPEMIHNLLIIVALGFLLCFALGIAKDKLRPILAKVIRKDRIKQFSLFQIGKRIAQFLQEK